MAAFTIKDIARICNVGTSTVSRAINDDPGINKDTRERILQVIEEYHYVPNNSARNLKMNESNTIALIIKGIENQFFQGMLKNFEEELKKMGYSFLIHALGETQDDARAAVALAKEKRLKGIIFLGGLLDYSKDIFKRLDILKGLDIPYVLCTVAFDKNIPQVHCSSVAINDVMESYRAVQYLIQKGHKKIAIIPGKRNDCSVGQTRLAGYEKALKDNGIEYDQKLVRFMKDDIPSYTAANGYATAKELLKEGVEFTALYTISDLTAFGAYKAIAEAGKSIPEDCSVMGFDGLELTKYLTPALTTIEQPREELVKTSIQLLMDKINGHSGNKHVVLEAELVERDSVRDLN